MVRSRDTKVSSGAGSLLLLRHSSVEVSRMARSHGVMVKLERFTAVLPILRDDAPKLHERAAAQLQDAHLSHLPDLHVAGELPPARPPPHPAVRRPPLSRGEPAPAPEV